MTMTGRSLALLFPLALLGGGLGAPHVTGQESLKEIASKVAGLWHTKDATGLEKLLRRDGIRFHLDEEKHSSLKPRKAIASVESFWSKLESRKASVHRTSTVGGDPLKGFAEIRWRAIAPGSAEVLRYTIYLEFVREGTSWVVSEIRILH